MLEFKFNRVNKSVPIVWLRKFMGIIKINEDFSAPVSSALCWWYLKRPLAPPSRTALTFVLMQTCLCRDPSLTFGFLCWMSSKALTARSSGWFKDMKSFTVCRILGMYYDYRTMQHDIAETFVHSTLDFRLLKSIDLWWYTQSLLNLKI